MIRIEEVTDRARLTALRGPWDALVSRAAGSDIFHTYDWVSSWLECFWKDRPIAFLVAWEDGLLVGLAPFVHEQAVVNGCTDALALPVNSHTRRQDVICTGDAGRILEAMLEHLQKSGRRVRLTLRQTLEESPVARALPVVAHKLHLGSMRTELQPSPVVKITGTWDEYLASRTGQVARELKRKMRKVERDWKATWTVVGEPEQCAAALQEVWKIEEQSWKQLAGTSLAAEKEAVELYESFVPRFAAAGWLRMYLLHLDGKPAAHILGAEYNNEYFALKTSYDSEFKAASPGQAIFFYALRDAFERKLRVFDFLGNDSRWKGELANAERRHVAVCAHSKLDAYCAWHRLYETNLKPFARENAPKLVALGKRFVTPQPASPDRKVG